MPGFRRVRALIEQGLTVGEAVAQIKVGKTTLYAALSTKSDAVLPAR
jgi:hypothetical protein